MVTLLEELKSRALAFLSRLSARQRRMALVAAPVFLVTFLAGHALVRRGFYRPLFRHLSPQDAAAVVRELEAQKIPYQLAEDGSAVEVPRSVVYRTRLELAGKGLPMGGGVGFEIFERNSFGASEFTQRVNYLRALQGELARTINAMEAVQSSRVHLALPARSGFFGPEEKPSASVVMDLKPGRRLTSEQARGIVKLVAASVPGLTPERVTVVDTAGGLLSASDAGEAGGSDDLHRLRTRTEKEIEARIQSMLEPVIGAGRAIARVNVQLNFRETEEVREEFDPEKQVVRSQQQVSEGPVAGAAGVPGVQSNVPGGDRAKAPEAAKEAQAGRTSQFVTYEVGRVTSKSYEPRGRIERISAAVVVDGKYDEKGAYAPRSAEEMEALKTLVKKAIGFDEERGDQLEVVNVPIRAPAAAEPAAKGVAEESGWQRSPLLWGAVAAAVLALAAAAFFLLRRRGGAARQAEESREQAKQELAGAVERIVIAPDPRREQLAQIARDYRDEVVPILRMWLLEAERRPALGGAEEEKA